jgi:hypothetical protein
MRTEYAEGTLIFEGVKVDGAAKGALAIQRARVRGGWLIAAYLFTLSFKTASLTFYPDPEHRWDGSSLPVEKEPQEAEEGPNPFFPGRPK